METTITELYAEGRELFQRVLLDRESLGAADSADATPEWNESWSDNYLSKRIFLKFSTLQRRVGASSESHQKILDSLVELFSAPNMQPLEEENQSKVPYNILLRLYSTELKNLIREIRTNPGEILALPNSQI